MKSRSKNRRHQTAYEAPEVEGEFLNESADIMLSVSDSLGNLTSSSLNEIDSSLLEEFNEDQGPRESRPIETIVRPTKRAGASRSGSAYLSARANLDSKKAREKLIKESSQPRREDEEDDLKSRSDLAVSAIKSQVIRVASKVQDLKDRLYLLVLGAMVAGFALAKIVEPSSHSRK